MRFFLLIFKEMWFILFRLICLEYVPIIYLCNKYSIGSDLICTMVKNTSYLLTFLILNLNKTLLFGKNMVHLNSFQ